MIEAVSRAEESIASRRAKRTTEASTVTAMSAERVSPVVRGVLADLSARPRERAPILERRATKEIDAFLARPDALALTLVGCATPDHVIRTKPTALLVRARFEGDEAAFAAALRSEILAYAEAYDAYFAAMCSEKAVTKTKLDPWPKILLVPGLGLLAVGATRAEASIAADIYEHTIRVMTDAADVGTYAPVSRADLFDVEYWSLEQAKLKKSAERELAGRVAMITGAASGIGRATASRFAELGAHVLLVDRDADALAEVSTMLGRGRASQVAHAVADVTSWADVERAVGHAVETFGGLDLVVSNAGTAPEGRLDEERGDAQLRTSLDQNLLSHNHVARAATRVMRAQGRGGCLLFNASKSAFNQGPGFGPYAVAKAGLVALMRQYAVDLGAVGIRANAVNADRIRTSLFGGGVAESRAKARGVEVDEYFRANLLHQEVTADDVAASFAYLATARSTTGAVITVDGGNAAAFPR
jgi:NAD(P)-dependent dehydrogenase (short-subunit alcohol dehydrogenase family)